MLISGSVEVIHVATPIMLGMYHQVEYVIRLNNIIRYILHQWFIHYAQLFIMVCSFWPFLWSTFFFKFLYLIRPFCWCISVNFLIRIYCQYMYVHFSLFVNFTNLIYNVRCISFFVHYVYFDYLVHLVSLVFVIHVTFPFAHFHMLSILSLCTPSILFRLLDDRLQFLHYLLKVPPFGRVLLPTLQHQAVAGLWRVIRGLHSVPYNGIW